MKPFNQNIRNLCFIISFSCFSALITSAQNTVEAIFIEQKIKAGEDVSYNNVTITGILDMTSGREDTEKLDDKLVWTNNEVKTIAKGNISFENCTFEDHVYAYYHNKNISHTGRDSRITYTVDFDGEVIFKNCTFKERAWFKYSEFEERSDFSGNVFEGSSTFKYAKFHKPTTFAQCRFEDESTFKYTKFRELVSFEDTIFEEDADFKYTNFEDGVSFNSAIFEDDLNFKYTHIEGSYDNENMLVKGNMDVKYFVINGEKVHKKERRKKRRK